MTGAPVEAEHIFSHYFVLDLQHIGKRTRIEIQNSLGNVVHVSGYSWCVMIKNEFRIEFILKSCQQEEWRPEEFMMYSATYGCCALNSWLENGGVLGILITLNS